MHLDFTTDSLLAAAAAMFIIWRIGKRAHRVFVSWNQATLA